jgi:hypothetical protein
MLHLSLLWLANPSALRILAIAVRFFERRIHDLLEGDFARMQLSGQENIASRKVRHFAVYKSTKLMFKAESKPGALQSLGQAGTQAAPKHAWINALSFRGSAEQEWVALLRQAKNFDGFLKLLVTNGYDLFSVDKAPAPLTISEGHRIVDGDILVAVTWNHPGQCSTLQGQPEVGILTNKEAAMVVYDTQKGSSFGQLYARTKSYEALLEAIKSTRMKATSV